MPSTTEAMPSSLVQPVKSRESRCSWSWRWPSPSPSMETSTSCTQRVKLRCRTRSSCRQPRPSTRVWMQLSLSQSWKFAESECSLFRLIKHSLLGTNDWMSVRPLLRKWKSMSRWMIPRSQLCVRSRFREGSGTRANCPKKSSTKHSMKVSKACSPPSMTPTDLRSPGTSAGRPASHWRRGTRSGSPLLRWERRSALMPQAALKRTATWRLASNISSRTQARRRALSSGSRHTTIDFTRWFGTSSASSAAPARKAWSTGEYWEFCLAMGLPSDDPLSPALVMRTL
mmetsp:Transcript_60857/g.178534  ORF Transcript_60857/g.178534 Transcript_60857/m.178534 type:complete len:285 (-) Transcript_60857:1301-2155(-)